MTTRSGASSYVSSTAALSRSARNSAVPTCRSDIWTIFTRATYATPAEVERGRTLGRPACRPSRASAGGRGDAIERGDDGGRIELAGVSLVVHEQRGDVVDARRS